MSALTSIALAIDLATRKRDQADQSVMQARSAHLFAQDQMAQLETYAAETEVRWTAAAKLSTTPELMQHHYQFMDRLHHAIGLQKEVLANSDRRVEGAKRMALEAEFKLMSLKQMLKKKQAGIAIIQTRREQKQMDEFAAMQTRRSTGEFSSGERS